MYRFCHYAQPTTRRDNRLSTAETYKMLHKLTMKIYVDLCQQRSSEYD